MRRPKGEGSITRQPSGNYRVRIEVPSKDGKRHWKTATAKTRKEATELLRHLQASDDSHTEDTQDNLRYLMDDYIAAKELEGLRKTALQTIKNHLNVFYRFVEGLKAQEISKTHVQAFLNNQRALGLSDRTLQYRLNYIKSFFQWLYEEEVVGCNPTTSIKLKKTRPPKPRDEVLSKEEHTTLKRHLENLFFDFLVEYKWNLRNRMYPLYLLTFETGMREGEVAGLKWENVDFSKSTVSVVSKISTIASVGYIETLPKSYAGYRTIKVSSKTMNVLKELKEAYEDRGYKSKYVFFNNKKAGQPYTPNAVLRSFKSCLKEAGIDRHFTFHGIRHTNASIMHNEGVSDVVAAARLGHADVSTYLKVYTHVLPDDKDRNRALVEA